MSAVVPIKNELIDNDTFQPKICNIRSEAESSMESNESQVFESLLTQICNAELSSVENRHNLSEEFQMRNDVCYSNESNYIVPDDETLIVKELMSMIYNVIAKKSRIKKYISTTNVNLIRFQIENPQTNSLVILHCTKVNLTLSNNNCSHCANNNNSNNNNNNSSNFEPSVIKQEPSLESKYILPDECIPVTEIMSSSSTFNEHDSVVSNSSQASSSEFPNESAVRNGSSSEGFEMDVEQNPPQTEANINQGISEGPHEYLISQKGRQMFLFEGYMYKMDKVSETTGRTYWRCSNTRCKGRISKDRCENIKVTTCHSHPPNPSDILAKRAKHLLKTLAISCKDPPQRLIARVRQDLGEESVYLSNYSNLVRLIERHRKRNNFK